MSGERLLVVEDESDIAEILEYNLVREGFKVQIQSRGDSALEAIRKSPPNLVLLDLMLPGLDGLELARILKRDESTANLPIIMLTAKGEEIDRIVGLELGADDYVTKPFSPREVVLRVKSVLRRRSYSQDEEPTLESGSLRLDVPEHRFTLAGAEVFLTATEFRLMRVLMSRPGRAFARSRLLSDVWGYSEDVASRTVDTHIRRLRRKLGDEAERVETVVGVGYRLRS
jgi:two-component system phosphate regulon response regulator PhoB